MTVPLTAPALAPDAHVEQILSAYDDAMEVALRGVERAYMDAGGEWAERMHAAIARLVELAVANPRLTRLCTVEIFDAGQLGLDRRDRSMLRFMRLCELGYAQSAPQGLSTRLVPKVVAGAVFELVRSHVVENRLERLPEALPTATLIVLSPIIGRDQALRIAGF